MAPVLELANREVREAADRLGAIQQKLEQEQFKAQQLREYSQETLDSIGTTRTVDMQTMIRQRGFAERMETACLQQEAAIARVQQVYEQALEQWQLKSQKEKKLNELVQQYRDDEQFDRDKKEQAMIDDLTSLRFR